MVDAIPAIHCNYTNDKMLYLAYMPYLQGGGLFIRTSTVYELGSKITLIIQLLSEPETFEIEGKVVWITPKGAQGNKPVGIGVQFMGETSRLLCNKIETYLAGMLKSTHPTDTM